MKIAERFEYPATPEVVAEMVSDEAFQAAKCEATHPLSHKEKVTAKGDKTEIVTTRVLPTDGFPDVVKSLVGPKIAVTETYLWGPAKADGSRDGTINLALGDGNLPVAMTGTITLRPGGAGSVISIDAELKARIPLLGGKIEKAAAPPILDAIKKERETGLEWLAG